MSRLSRAIDVADDEMEEALRRTEEVHRITEKRREREISELRRVIAAKERGIDSLRETLSGTKRALEGRMRQLEDAIMQRDDDVRSPCLLSCISPGVNIGGLARPLPCTAAAIEAFLMAAWRNCRLAMQLNRSSLAGLAALVRSAACSLDLHAARSEVRSPALGHWLPGCACAL